MNAEAQRAIAAAERVLGVPLQHVTELSGDDRRHLILRASTPSLSVIIKATHDKDYRLDRAYRDALPIDVDDGAFRQEMAMLLFVRMFASQAWLLERALSEDVTWGISTNRPRLLWHLEPAIAGAEGVVRLDGLRATAMRWRDDLGRRWPDAQPLALYPAFR
jgi:hypothetical protein